MIIAYIWILGVVLSTLASYLKDMRGKYVSGGQLILILFLAVVPFFNFVFGISYFIAVFLDWSINGLRDNFGTLVWDKTGFKLIKKGDKQ